jgi:gliding motility-associated-like protein/CSLREA domain-containing protein
MRSYLLFASILYGVVLNSQVYTVNSNNDFDDGLCDAIHCSFREAIKAAEADGVPSIIQFNISGSSVIIPTGPFPIVTKNDLTILGETQPGGAGTVVIDFTNRNFGGNSFWEILGSRFYLSGISFTHFLFDNLGDQIFQFGDLLNNSTDSKIYNCAFIDDFFLNAGLGTKRLINIFFANRFSISNCYFGTDHVKSSISKMTGYLFIDSNQGSGLVNIDSNIMVNAEKMIEQAGGVLYANENIFGALDTSKNKNFLDPLIGIFGVAPNIESHIDNNFFFGFKKSAIDMPMIGTNFIYINKNRFYENDQDISIAGVGSDDVYIMDNYGRNGKTFVGSSGIREINIARNDISNYNTFYYNLNDPKNRLVGFIDNKMTCINTSVVTMDPTFFPAHAIPAIASVNRNQITGTGNPNDSIIVYSNNRISCPNAVCQGGVQLGRTRADASGNWILNVAYPNNTSISAYQFESNPSIRPSLYSEFSPCYRCAGLKRLDITPTICSGQTFTYRSKVYSESNPYDSIPVPGDNISICDSIIIVNVSFNASYRSHLDVKVCYGDTLRYDIPTGQVIIHKDHLIDSLVLKSVFDCDSVTTISGTEVGFSNFSQTICESDSVVIFKNRFDKNNPSGIARDPGGAQAGCDSVVSVNLTVVPSVEFNLDSTMCPGQSITIGAEVFNQSRLSGDATLKNTAGCDSIVHVSLSYPNNVGTFTTDICKGDSVLVVNTYFSDKNPNGQVIDPAGSSFGCDSIINVSINIIPDAVGSFDTVMCESQTRTLHGQTFSVQNPKGTIILPKASSRLCDSTLNVTITFIPESGSNYTPTICRNGSVMVGNQLFDVNNPSGMVPLKGAAGCDSIVNVNLSINPSIFIDFTTIDLKCNQSNSGELIIDDIRGGFGNFKISIDSKTPVDYTPGMIEGNLFQGNHTIRISDTLSCDTTYNFTINNSQLLDLQLPGDTTIKKGNSVNISAFINFNSNKIIWDPADFLSCDTCLNTTSTPDNTITYTLTVSDENDCTISESMTITVLIDVADIYLPNAFSPNGDNINDLFKPEFKIPENTRILIFQIFDRWGNLIYERTNGIEGETFGWDGSVDQEKMNPGVYGYIIQFVGEDGVVKWKTGDVTLIR